MNREEIISTLVEYLERKKPIPDRDAIAELDYLAAGYVDSIGFMKYLMFVEDRFDLEFEDEEIESDAFRTIGGLAQMIGQKLEEKKACH
jgi:acyl carrier protein